MFYAIDSDCEIT
jgi:hypothetical protein